MRVHVRKGQKKQSKCARAAARSLASSRRLSCSLGGVLNRHDSARGLFTLTRPCRHGFEERNSVSHVESHGQR
jgi:hypothetical protein